MTEPPFNRNIDYVTILEKLRDEFEQRWLKDTPSPSTNLEKYVEKAVLGVGSFGTVLLIKEKTSNNYYAAKAMHKDELVRLKQVTHVFNEKRILRSVQFPFLMSMVASTKDFDNIYLILPFVNGGELFTYHRRVRKFSEKQARFYAAQVFLALEYLHNVNLIYRDLKPENILIDSQGYLKLIDFGFTKLIDSRTTTLCGTPEYLAPEIIQSKAYGIGVDWWAFGILVYEFVAGYSPFSMHSSEVLLMYSKICTPDYLLPAYFTPALKAMIDNLLQVELSKRLGVKGEGVKELKEHEWFFGIDWYSILNKEINAPYVPAISNMEDLSNFEKFNAKIKTNSKVNRQADLFESF